MKKLIFLLMVLLSSGVQAQIQKNILGFTLGVTPKQTVIQTLQNKGFECSLKEDAIKTKVFYTVKGGLSFGGYIWYEAMIGFVNGKLSSVMLSGDLNKSQYNKLKDTLISKYHKYQTSHSNPPSFYDFHDRKTEVSLWYHRDGWVIICYSDETDSDNSTSSSSLKDL